MERHLLLAISDEASWWGLRFVCRFFEDKSQLKLTLLYVAPALFDMGGGIGADAAADIVMSDRQHSKAKSMVESAREWAIARGFAPSHVSAKVVVRQYGVIRDIVEEAHRGLYDAVVVGRRYLTWIEQFVGSSVSRGLLWQNIDFPVWVCPLSKPERKNVLLCVDGSPESMRVVDHVGFVLAQASEHAVTLLHLTDPPVAGKDYDVERYTALCSEDELALGGRGGSSVAAGRVVESGGGSEGQGGSPVLVPCTRATKIFAAARRALEENGVAGSRISMLSLGARNKAEAIVRLAEEDRYAVIAAGRREKTKSFVSRLAALTVSQRLHEDAGGAALWLSK